MERGATGRTLPSPLWDAAAYTACAVHAFLLARHSGFALHERWGRLALAPYVVAAAGAVALRLARGDGRAGRRFRLGLVVMATIGALVVPLAINVEHRAERGPAGAVLSEALVVEDGARVAVHGGDPYAAVFRDEAFTHRDPAIRHHFPYLPGMLAFGLPRAVFGAHLLTDARVVFLLFSLVVVALAFAAAPTTGRLLGGGTLLLFALSPGALALSTGGDDVPVLALLLLAAVLAAGGRSGRAGIAAGTAMALKQIAWPVAILLAVHVARRDRRAARRMVAGAATVTVPFLLPVLVWSPGAFFDDAVRYPLGLTKLVTVAASPTVGRFFASAVETRAALVVAVVVVLAVFALAVRQALVSLPGALAGSGILLTAAVVLAPASRFGLLLYPIHLTASAVLMKVPPA